MNVSDYVAVVVGITTVTATLLTALKWMIKHYLAELKPNGGGSMNALKCYSWNESVGHGK